MSELELEIGSPGTQREVDARGLNCPLPILRTKKTLAEMASGETVRVISSDPHSMRDFDAFCKQTGHTLVEKLEVHGGEFHFLLRRK